MKNIKCINGEWMVELRNGLIACYSSGGYWHVVDSNDDLVYAWVTADQIRNFNQ
jgi:hypothetical protein